MATIRLIQCYELELRNNLRAHLHYGPSKLTCFSIQRNFFVVIFWGLLFCFYKNVTDP